MARTFSDFVAHQVSRCEALPSGMGYTYSESAQSEIGDWLESKAGIAWDTTKQSDMHWLAESTVAQRIKAVIDEIMDGDRAPSIGDIRAVWTRLHGQQSKVARDCPDCDGTGWQIVSIQSIDAARKCPRGCVAPPDKIQAVGGGSQADNEANAAWAELVGGEIAAKLAKPIVPKREPPPLKNPITEADLAQVEKFKQ